MSKMIMVWLFLITHHILGIAAETNPNDLAVLNALKSTWKNLPPDWNGADPCGSSWTGINCTNSRVISFKLAGTGVGCNDIGDISSFSELQYLDLSNSKGVRGILPPSIGNLKNLTVLMLIGCGFFGPIPDSIGSLSKLVYLGLNNNSFVGQIPPSIGSLSKLSWLDLSENNLTGPIPVSTGMTPGLDMLLNARHFHLAKNQFSGTIPPRLFSSNMSLLHLVLDNNRLSGSIPTTLRLATNLEMLRLDWNSFSGPILTSLNELSNITELNLSHNKFTGPIPDLTGMNKLSYVDMSNNNFIESDVPSWFTDLPSLTTLDMSNNNFIESDVPSWFTDLPSLTTLLMSDTNIQGSIPSRLFTLPSLETVVLRNNRLNGTLDIGTSYVRNMNLSLENNAISDFSQRTGYNLNLTLKDNPICGPRTTDRFCIVETPNSPSISKANSCKPISCSSDQVMSLNCKCAHPYTGTMHFYSFSFSNLGNSSYFTTLQETLLNILRSNNIPVDSIALSDAFIDDYSYLLYRLQIFPAGQDRFNQTAVATIGSLFNRQQFQLPYYGPLYFLDESYRFSGKNKSRVGIIVGATIGSIVLVLLIVVVGIYAFSQKRRAEKAIKQSDPFASWGLEKNSGSIPKIRGARWFSFEDLNKCTNNFSEGNILGIGGYGQVYKGVLSSGEIIAIKRAQQGSLQGANEFKTEIELLSRIHHKNVVGLVGFCYEQGEQMLVYEFISNGTLKDNLLGKSGMKLDWIKRLEIALDAAKGLTYLHELADPPIIHRDIKSTNILLDAQLIAKVADFGLSKPIGDSAKGYITTQVKGTLGYMDPEYYMTNQVTDKSDVYSFGVVLLELLTARAPIHQGRYIVKEMKAAKGKLNDSYALHELLDSALGSDPVLVGLTKFVNLAMSCVSETSDGRPRMSEVVREIENVIQLARLNYKPGSLISSQKGKYEADLYDSYGESDLYDSTTSDYSRTAVSFETQLR